MAGVAARFECRGGGKDMYLILVAFGKNRILVLQSVQEEHIGFCKSGEKRNNISTALIYFSAAAEEKDMQLSPKIFPTSKRPARRLCTISIWSTPGKAYEVADMSLSGEEKKQKKQKKKTCQHADDVRIAEYLQVPGSPRAEHFLK